jgi:hypothetical protein
MDATISLSREENVYTQTADAGDTNSLVLTAGTDSNQDDGMYFASEARVFTDGGKSMSSMICNLISSTSQHEILSTIPRVDSYKTIG